MAKPYWETHPNPNEYFPLKGTLGGPGETAKGAALLGNLLAAAAALALAAAAMFFPYADCTPLAINATSARFEAEAFNLEPDQDVFWHLITGPAPQELPEDIPDDPYLLEENPDRLYLTDLEPGTEYTILLFTENEDGTKTLLHSFTFQTPGEKEPPTPPADPPSDPPKEPNDPPPVDDPPDEPPQVPENDPEDKDPEESTPPALTPPPSYTPGAGSGNKEDGEEETPSAPPSAPTGPSTLPSGETDSSVVLSFPDPGTINGPFTVTLTINDIYQGAAPLYVDSIYVEIDGNPYIHLTDMAEEVTGTSYIYSFDLDPSALYGTDPSAWPNWIEVDMDVSGYSYADPNDPSTIENTSTYARDEIPLVGTDQIHRVSLSDSVVGKTFNGFTCTGVYVRAGSEPLSPSLSEVIEGQEVLIWIDMEKTGSSEIPEFDITSQISLNPNTVPLTTNPTYSYDDHYNRITLNADFIMPATDVSLSVDGFTIIPTPGTVSLLPPEPAPAPTPVAPAPPAPVSQMQYTWNAGSKTLDGSLTIAESETGSASVRLTNLVAKITSPEIKDVTPYILSGLPQASADPSQFAFPACPYTLPLTLDLSGLSFSEVVGGGLPSEITLEVQATTEYFNSETEHTETVTTLLTQKIPLN